VLFPDSPAPMIVKEIRSVKSLINKIMIITQEKQFDVFGSLNPIFLEVLLNLLGSGLGGSLLR